MDENFENEFDDVEVNDETEVNSAADSGETGESKAEKFKRLAQNRTNNALKQISGIGKLATSAYEYTPEQVEKIFGALQGALDEAKGKFEKTKSSAQAFTL